VKRLLAAALLFGACASATPRRPPPGPSDDVPEAESLYERVRSLDAELKTLAADVAPPDCAQVDSLHTNICALAARICQIAEQQPAGSPVQARCEDGRARCKSAGDRARSRGCTQK
jgi:hypothetical protein